MIFDEMKPYMGTGNFQTYWKPKKKRFFEPSKETKNWFEKIG